MTSIYSACIVRHINGGAMITNKVDLYQYISYRKFLSDAFDLKKQSQPQWSYNAWANHLGLKNNTTLLKIIHGQREAGPKVKEKLFQYFKFNTTQRKYFNDLIELSKVQNNPSLSVPLLTRIKHFNPSQKKKKLSENEFQFISNWWFYAIRQLVRIKGFKNNIEWIEEKLLFSVSYDQISHAIQTMIDLGFLKQTNTGKLTLSKGELSTTEDIPNNALKKFHQSMLTLAKKSLQITPVESREISGITLCLNTEDIPKAKKYISKMQDDFDRIFDKKNGNAIYQFQVQLFPLTTQGENGQ